MLQMVIAKTHNIPVVQQRLDFSILDYYYWLPRLNGQLGCFPSNYAGIRKTGGCPPCFKTGDCDYVRKNLCMKWE